MSNFIKIRPVAAEMFRVDIQTDGWADITKVNSRFPQFCECTQQIINFTCTVYYKLQPLHLSTKE